MGRDLLAEDYILKQITASLIYPDSASGKVFWKRVYEEASKRFGSTNIPVSSFNKVWIVPEQAVVYENANSGTAYVVESRLKVMLEQDYLSLQNHAGISSTIKVQDKDANQLGSQMVREVVIPELTREVNEGKNFVQLRQVYNSLILANWYKKKVQNSILSLVYEGKNKVAGVTIDDPQEKTRIYQQYLKAFKKGVCNLIREEIDPVTQQPVPRKYFSGGVQLSSDHAMTIRTLADSFASKLRQLLPKLWTVSASVAPALETTTQEGMEGQKSMSSVGNEINGLFKIIVNGPNWTLVDFKTGQKFVGYDADIQPSIFYSKDGVAFYVNATLFNDHGVKHQVEATLTSYEAPANLGGALTLGGFPQPERNGNSLLTDQLPDGGLAGFYGKLVIGGVLRLLNSADYYLVENIQGGSASGGISATLVKVSAEMVENVSGEFRIKVQGDEVILIDVANGQRFVGNNVLMQPDIFVSRDGVDYYVGSVLFNDHGFKHEVDTTLTPYEPLDLGSALSLSGFPQLETNGRELITDQLSNGRLVGFLGRIVQGGVLQELNTNLYYKIVDIEAGSASGGILIKVVKLPAHSNAALAFGFDSLGHSSSLENAFNHGVPLADIAHSLLGPQGAGHLSIQSADQMHSALSLATGITPYHTDKAMTPGGIDLTANQINLQLQNAGKAIEFHVNPAMLAQLKNVSGFKSMVIGIQRMTELSLKQFLGM